MPTCGTTRLALIDPLGLWCVWEDDTHDDDPSEGGSSVTGCEKQGGHWDPFDTITGILTDGNGTVTQINFIGGGVCTTADCGAGGTLEQFDQTLNGYSVAPAANNGTDPSCGITVKCRGIEYGKLGKLGFQHCDAQVTTSSGQVWSLSGGPQPYGDITALNAWAISPPTAPFTGTTVYQGNSCSAGQCMIQSTQAWKKDVVKPIYSATSGPNSNTWLKGTAAGCGVSLPINTWGSIW